MAFGDLVQCFTLRRPVAAIPVLLPAVERTEKKMLKCGKLFSLELVDN